MDNIQKYRGILPAMYACYSDAGHVSASRTKALTENLIRKGVKGLYVCGSSGECIYLDKQERMATLEAVMSEAGGKLTVVAHVACNNTADSAALAAHAESLGVDAIAAIPPIYFHLSEAAIARYWNDISSAAPHTPFIIYNIPQLAGVQLTVSLLREMLKNPRVIGVKNSSMSVLDIQIFKAEGGKDFAVFNGPDEQFLAGRTFGADGGIGGTYSVMPELFVRLDQMIREGLLTEAVQLQKDINEVIFLMLGCKGSILAAAKEIFKKREGIELGSVRRPLPELAPEDMPKVETCVRLIGEAISRYGITGLR